MLLINNSKKDIIEMINVIGGDCMAGKQKVALACSVCGSRNYTKSVSEGHRTERLELKKYCKYCGAHTLHRETK